MNVGELCRACKNWFEKTTLNGTFTIENGVIAPSVPAINNQYIRIIGSVMNDGVYKFDSILPSELHDETFDGAIVLLAIPREFIDLAARIDEYQAKGGGATPFASESFGGYSYTKGSKTSGAPSSWQDVFADDLARWRKL